MSTVKTEWSWSPKEVKTSLLVGPLTHAPADWRQKSVWAISITMTEVLFIGSQWGCCMLSSFIYFFFIWLFNHTVFIWSHFTLIKLYGGIIFNFKNMLFIHWLLMNSSAQYVNYKPNEVQNHPPSVFVFKLELKVPAIQSENIYNT